MEILPVLEGPLSHSSTSRRPALGSGLVGAIGATALNQVAKRYLPAAPRLDLLGRQLVAAAFEMAGRKPPRRGATMLIALVGDLVSNSLFYGLIGLGKPRTAMMRGAALGLAMGAGAVLLPAPLGADPKTTARTHKTVAQTILWYTLGGLLAALWYSRTSRRA